MNKCDFCKRDDVPLYHALMPRHKKRWVKDAHGTKIVPVEVKSSTYKTHVSLDEFCKKYSSRIANDRYLIYTKDYDKEDAVKYLPAYLAYFL